MTAQKQFTVDVPQILFALAKPVAAKYGCGVIVDLSINTKSQSALWTVEMEKEQRKASGPTFSTALACATEDLPEACEDAKALRERARGLLERAYKLEKGIA